VQLRHLLPLSLNNKNSISYNVANYEPCPECGKMCREIGCIVVYTWLLNEFNCDEHGLFYTKCGGLNENEIHL
jgi:hypothetical protein